MLGLVIAAFALDVSTDVREVTCRQVTIERDAVWNTLNVSAPYLPAGHARESDNCDWQTDSIAVWNDMSTHSHELGTQYYLTILPSFAAPYTLVFSADQYNESGVFAAIYLELKRRQIGNYEDSQQPNFLVVQTPLTDELVREIMNLADETTICEPEAEELPGLDGDDWNFEIITSSQTCRAHYWSPQDGPNYDFGVRLIELGNELLEQYLESESEE